MIRLFIAFPLEQSVTDQLGRMITSLKQYGADVKWVAPQNIHLTTCFLGDTDQSKVPAINKIIDEIASQHSKVVTKINLVGGFPTIERARVIWAGMAEGGEQLGATTAALVGKVRRLGFTLDDKPFKPHLTLGRVREGGTMGELGTFLKSYSYDPIPVTFDRLTLFESTLTPQGPIYKGLHSGMMR
jgi:RNA 2',3'-cyclic 3'-phosphodiesterase